MRPSVATVLVLVSGLAVRDGRAGAFDARVREHVSELRTPERDAVVRVATDLGSMYGVGIVAGALALSGRSDLAVRVGLSGATAWTLAQGAKPLLPRERPYQADGAERLVVEPVGSSWPSGHPAVAMAMASTLGEGRGSVPIDLRLREGGDDGTPMVLTHPDAPASKVITAIAADIIKRNTTLIGRSLPLSVG